MGDWTVGGWLMLACAAGAVVAWLFARFRAAEALRLEVTARQDCETRAALLQDRLLRAEQDVATARSRGDTLEAQGREWRDALDLATNEQARLTERASRVPGLEAESARLAEALATSGREVQRLAASEAQKAEAATALADRVKNAEAASEELSARMDATVDLLREAGERRAALEEQATRVSPLEQELAGVRTKLEATSAALSELREASGRDVGRLSAELAAEQQAVGEARQELAAVREALAVAEARGNALTDELTDLRARSETATAHAEEKLRLLVEAKDVLTDQFKTLATDILEEKSKRFAEQNQASLGQLLEPLRTRLSDFQGKVEEVYVQEGKDRSALAAQVRQLMDLNQTLSQDAKNLTHALKGSAKTQGNWGELILERVLEASGLTKGREYCVQDSQIREDGTRAQPDVVIDLPEERKLVVDSKLSLVAYERYVSAENDDQRTVALKQHVDSVRAHIKGLSEKRYQDLYGKTLDFVLAFVPIEPAFMLAVTHDGDLYMEAWRRNVLLVSPSTLLFVVRIVAHLWRQEAQSKNAQDIAKRGAELYDKLCGFVDDLQAVGVRLGQAQKAYDAAQGKLVSGKGNVIRQAEMLKGMGVRPSKALPGPLIELAGSDGDEIVVPGLVTLSTAAGQPALEAASTS